DWQHVSYTFSLDEDVENFSIYFLNNDTVGNELIKMTQFKLEKGNKATDWSPAPEDLANDPSNYKWQKVKGQDGVSIKSITEYYLASNKSTGITIGTTGWKTAVQKMSSTKKYLWNYEKSEFTD